MKIYGLICCIGISVLILFRIFKNITECKMDNPNNYIFVLEEDDFISKLLDLGIYIWTTISLVKEIRLRGKIDNGNIYFLIIYILFTIWLILNWIFKLDVKKIGITNEGIKFEKEFLQWNKIGEYEIYKKNKLKIALKNEYIGYEYRYFRFKKDEKNEINKFLKSIIKNE